MGFSKQRKKPGWRRSYNCVQNAFFRLSPSGRTEKTPLRSNSTISVSYHHFGWAFPSSAKSRVEEGRIIAFKTRFFDFPHRGETIEFHETPFQAAQKAEGRPIAFKTRFLDFPHRGETKKHPCDRIPHTTILVGFSKQRKKPGWRRSSNCVQNAFFDFPHRGETKRHPCDRIPRFPFHTTILGGLFQAGQKAGLTNVVQLRSKRVFSTFPIGAKRKNTLRIEFHEVGFIPPFWVGFSKQGKKPGWRTSSNCVQNAFFRLSPSGRNEKTPLRGIPRFRFHTTILGGLFQAAQKAGLTKVILRSKRVFSTFPIGAKRKNTIDRIPRFRFHTTILGGLFQAGQKAGLTNVVQLRSKRVFSTFPIGAKRNNTLGIEFHVVGFIPPFSVGFSKQGKKPGWRTSSNCVQNAFFRLSPSGRNEKTPLGSNSTRSVSYHHFEWAFPSRAKSRVDERRPIAFKTRFFDFPHRGETKKHP